MGLFQFKDTQIAIQPEVLNIPEFRALWLRDKSKGKEEAYKELAFIYYLEDFNSPYSSIPADIRESTVKKDFIRDEDWKKDDVVTKACEKYRMLTETPLSRLFKAVMGTIDRMAVYLDSAEIDDKTIKVVRDTIKEISSTITSYNKLQDATRKEYIGDSKTRGNKDIGAFER
jgi:hypothetical protein